MENKNLFLIYLGKSGCGPKFILDFSKAIIKDGGVAKFEMLISKHNLLKQELKDLKNDIHILNTPTSNKDAFTKSFNFAFQFLKILKSAKRDNVKNFMFPMTHIWNPLSMILIKTIIPNSNIFYVSHDANIHPGEKNAKLQYLIMQIEITLSNKIITLTETVKNIIKNRWKKKNITVLEHPFYDFGKTETPKNLSQIPTFLFFGRIVKYKGLELFMEAVDIFKKKIKDFKIIIAGSGEIEKETLKKINQNNKIELINRYIDEKEIPEIWDRSDICMLPYIEASQSGLVAIAVNKAMPCIITPVGGLAEQCKIAEQEKTFALMSDSIDPEKISNSMLRMLDKNIYYKLSKNAISQQKELSWDKWIKEIDKLSK